MDVNASRFHLVQGAGDWLALLQPDSSLWWDDERAALSLAPRLLRFPQRPAETPPALADRRGAACDRYANLHWLDHDQRTIRVLAGGTQTVGTFWQVEQLQEDTTGRSSAQQDFQPCTPQPPTSLPVLRGLTITNQHYLVVGTLEPAGLLIFDLHAGSLPRWLQWPSQVAFAPFDMAPAADGGVYILDRGPAPGEARYWRLDRYFRVVPARNGDVLEILAPAQDDFKPLGGSPRTIPGCDFPLGITLGAASPVTVAEPVAIAALPDDSVLLLETDPGAPASVIHRYRDGHRLNQIALADGLLDELLEQPQIVAHDFAFLPTAAPEPGSVNGELFIVAGDGNQAFAFALHADGATLTLVLRARYLPLRRFTGKALVTAGADVLYDVNERWLPLTEQPRRRFQPEATLAGLIFDGKQPDCVWHRLLLDACIPAGDSVQVESRAANQRERLADSPWRREPPLYLRRSGSELPYHQPFTGEQREGTGTWELLFQNANGRFLELRLSLCGSARSTPRLYALRVWYPRFSYLHEYLPAVYGDDLDAANFLDRWLANPEGLFTTLEGLVGDAQVLFDSRTAPSDYLDWLAGWLGAVLDPDWDDARRRLFIDYAELLFRRRGTPTGLLALIRLAIEPCPDSRIFADLECGCEAGVGRFGGRSVRIVEQFLRRRFAGVSLGDPRRLEQPGLVTKDTPYQPAQGPEPIHQRFRDFLGARHGSETLQQIWGQSPIRFPPLLPEDEARAVDWRAFTERGLGFTYATVSAVDAAFYREFLAHRYRLIESLNKVYQLGTDQRYEAFDEIELPGELPPNRQRLADWIGFVSLTLPIRHNAHRFTVLVPSEPDESPAVRERRLEQVRAILEQEKPAHTEFEVQLFWALFQVGGARLGLDTALGEGSRYVALVLDSGYLGGGFPARSHPWNVRDRQVIGRDPLIHSASSE